MEPVTFSALPRAVQVQLAVLGPLLFGMVCGFLLGYTATGFWISQVLGITGAVAGGFDHIGPRLGAARGALSGFVFSWAVLLAHAIADVTPTVDLADPLAVIVPVNTVIASLLGAAGGWLRARVTASPVA
jgi:hypothetical protein